MKLVFFLIPIHSHSLFTLYTLRGIAAVNHTLSSLGFHTRFQLFSFSIFLLFAANDVAKIDGHGSSSTLETLWLPLWRVVSGVNVQLSVVGKAR